MSRAGVEPATIGLKVESGGDRPRTPVGAAGKCPDLGKVDKVDGGRTPGICPLLRRSVNRLTPFAHLW